MKMSDKVYNILKLVAQYILPGLATLYFALASIWNLPYATQVIGTVTAIDTFLGALIGVSSAQYYKQLQNQLKDNETVDKVETEKKSN